MVKFLQTNTKWTAKCQNPSLQSKYPDLVGKWNFKPTRTSMFMDTNSVLQEYGWTEIQQYQYFVI